MDGTPGSGIVSRGAGSGSGSGTHGSGCGAVQDGHCADIPNPDDLKSGRICEGYGSCPGLCQGYDQYITQYCSGIDINFVKGLMQRESSCNKNAESPVESNGTRGCGLMQVSTTTDAECSQMKVPQKNIQEGCRILQQAISQANSLGYDQSRVTIKEVAAAIYNGGAGQSQPSSDCTASNGYGRIPMWACPLNPGTATFNACCIRDYGCNVGAC
jgi:hypothetical protein